MDLLDRYLAAVGLLLPTGQRKDIVEELRDVLLTRREERVAELGRPLAGEEEIALLRAFGHPLAVAARYAPQQYLVGPELYPHYVLVLKLLFAIIAVSAVIIGLVAETNQPGQPVQAILTALTALWRGTIEAVGVVTLIAAGLQHRNIRLKIVPDDWIPRDLPTLPKLRRETAFDHVAAIVALTVLVLWWSHGLPAQIPYVTDIPLKAGPHVQLTLAPIWTALYWPVLGLALGGIAARLLKLMGQAGAPSALALDLALHLAAVIVLGIALSAGDGIEVSAPGLADLAIHQIHFGVNLGVRIGLSVASVAAAGLAAYNAWRLYRARRWD